MAKLKRLIGVGTIATVTIVVSWTIATPPAQSNCSDWVGWVEYWQSPMQRYWQQLQQQTSYPWGQARPYGQLTCDHITLTADFNGLTGMQK
ncbi:hypothetical protein [Leptolyngbya ohadii]|uniref:hypothetical protein n=1 Tax=Leptolyngbya ohadii TaxID=1962290 RepID=UPI000B5997BD|nr:hypothetical protein [Leptolyngbya ohadii]